MAKAGRTPDPLRCTFAGVAGVVAVVALLGPARGQAPPKSPPGPKPAAAPANRAKSLDRAIALVDRARQTYQGVHDYSCVFVKRERVDGDLQPENVMTMTVRASPFSVALRWVAPKPSAGQEVCYVAGKNDGMMRVHPAGLLGSIGFVSIATDDARATQASRHPITEAGLGNLIDRLARQFALCRDSSDTAVSVGEYEYNRRRCVRVEVKHSDPTDGRFQAFRSVVYFDKESGLPTRVEAYDWPKSPDTKGELIAVYSYLDLKLNQNPADALFDR